MNRSQLLTAAFQQMSEDVNFITGERAYFFNVHGDLCFRENGRSEISRISVNDFATRCVIEHAKMSG